MNIRKAVPKDVRALAELESKWETSPGWGEKGILAELENPLSQLLVFEENRILGFAGCRFLPPEAQITTIVVSPRHTGKGIAKALLVRLLSESSLRGCACAVLEVDETNAPAIMLYKGMGFEIVGRRPKFYNGLRDALLMSKRIKVMSKAPLRRE